MTRDELIVDEIYRLLRRGWIWYSVRRLAELSGRDAGAVTDALEDLRGRGLAVRDGQSPPWWRALSVEEREASDGQR